MHFSTKGTSRMFSTSVTTKLCNAYIFSFHKQTPYLQHSLWHVEFHTCTLHRIAHKARIHCNITISAEAYVSTREEENGNTVLLTDLASSLIPWVLTTSQGSRAMSLCIWIYVWWFCIICFTITTSFRVLFPALYHILLKAFSQGFHHGLLMLSFALQYTSFQFQLFHLLL